MKPSRLALLAGGAAAVALINGWAARVLEPSAWAAGERLGELLGAAVTDDALPEVDWERLDEQLEEGQSSSPEATKAPAPKAGSGKSPSRSKAPTEGGSLFVSQERVLQLSRHAGVPASRYVPAKGVRPAGLQVAGVGALGIGVRDGDVLTKVAGAEARSSSGVISTVLKLRANKARFISGEFWRGEQRWNIVFEMPYLETLPPSGSQSAVPGATTPAPAGPASD